MNNYQLNTNWCLWYHGINDKNWKNSSYKNIYDICNAHDIKFLNETIQTIHLQNSMLFIMREGIFPTWEDPDNREGCCISFKIPNNILKEQFDLILNRILSEDLLKDKENIEYLNGLSIIPKKEFNIVKLWLRRSDENFTDSLKEYEPCFTKEKSLIKKHVLSD